MNSQSKPLASLIGLLCVAPLVSVHAEGFYLGAAFGVGGADVPIGSYASGYRGALRAFGGYSFNSNFALEAMTIDLGTPNDKPAGSNLNSTIGGIGAAAIGTLHANRWRFAGSLGVMSMDGRAANASTERSTQGILGVQIGFDVTSHVTLGLETGETHVKFGAPATNSANVHWSALTAVYRF